MLRLCLASASRRRGRRQRLLHWKQLRSACVLAQGRPTSSFGRPFRTDTSIVLGDALACADREFSRGERVSCAALSSETDWDSSAGLSALTGAFRHAEELDDDEGEGPWRSAGAAAAHSRAVDTVSTLFNKGAERTLECAAESVFIVISDALTVAGTPGSMCLRCGGCTSDGPED